ncbi:signal peptide peptidase SppA [Candidatus Woesearchaeota archaeon]|nr:signal peptide peptidase SppA [Candidatus Woesearchaeota archaeon]
MKKVVEINKEINNKNSFCNEENNFTEKSSGKRSRKIVLTLICLALFFLIIVPFVYTIFTKDVKLGNVAMIKINGPIMDISEGFLGQKTVTSEEVKGFIEDAEDNENVKVILLEINSPGGAPVASEEIAKKIKKVKKPVVALIKDEGTSGAYWIASSADRIFANRMSYTGSIGVISSYLEFSGLMDKYGVGYERLVAGDNKDVGIPYRKLTSDEEKIIQAKLDKVHDYFITAIAENRNLSEEKVRKLATGEFYLGSEALDLGLIDELGGSDEVEEYIKKTYELEKIEYAHYEEEAGLFELLTGVFTDFSFQAGRGFGSILLEGQKKMMLV